MTENDRKSFIENIAKYIQAECIARGYKYPSAIIAQACNESAYGSSLLSYKYYNYFGMKCGSKWKGGSVNLKTQEEYTPGKLTTIKDNFRTYESMIKGVAGYFDFISASRYANLKDAQSPRDYLEKIKADGYATASKYVDNVYKIIEKYNLTMYDIIPNQESNPKKVIVNTNASPLRLRKLPRGVVLALIPKGSEVKVLEYGTEWSMVQYKNIVGYCASVYLKEV